MREYCKKGCDLVLNKNKANKIIKYVFIKLRRNLQKKIIANNNFKYLFDKVSKLVQWSNIESFLVHSTK